MRSNITELPDISLSGIYKTYGYQDNMTYAYQIMKYSDESFILRECLLSA